jgi:hypothetical protein
LHPPAPIYRDLQGPLWRWPLANARRSNPQWHARDMVCEVAGNARGSSQGRTETVSFSQTLIRCPTSLPDNIAMPPGCTIKGKVAVRAPCRRLSRHLSPGELPQLCDDREFEPVVLLRGEGAGGGIFASRAGAKAKFRSVERMRGDVSFRRLRTSRGARTGQLCARSGNG